MKSQVVIDGLRFEFPTKKQAEAFADSLRKSKSPWAAALIRVEKQEKQRAV